LSIVGGKTANPQSHEKPQHAACDGGDCFRKVAI